MTSDLEQSWIEGQARRQAEYRARAIEDKIASVGAHYVRMTLESFAVTDETRRMHSAAVAFAEHDHALYIHGTVGSGKTHVLVGAYQRAVRAGISAQFVVFDDFVQYLKSQFGRDTFDEDEIIALLCSHRQLFIDDIGAGRSTEYATDILSRIIRRRLQYGMHKVMMTSNLSLSRLSESTDDRIASRIVEMCDGLQNVIDVKTTDMRIKGGSR